MILNRLGNKTRIAKDIICHFPQHRTFIDMFFGAGGIFFNKPLSAYSFCNDFDDDVFNLYMVLQSDKDELIKEFDLMPVNDTLFKYWTKNNENDPFKKAIRFLFLSNFTINGCGALRFGEACGNPKKHILSLFDITFSKLKNAQFMCEDFRNVLPKIQFRDKEENAFIYADPPYLGTSDNYSKSFTKNDTIDLFDVLINSKVKFALSEFNNPFIRDLAKDKNLEIIEIGDRRNMATNNKKMEILVVNYESPALYSLFRNQEQSLLIV